ncbi:hypothetical protein [Paraburkholderia ferrariae]|uniref:hypothetical protein n=1 Tax=Paraburkholderia ferrariae TaxID=386056 RepID=UPI00319E8FCA
MIASLEIRLAGGKVATISEMIPIRSRSLQRVANHGVAVKFVAFVGAFAGVSAARHMRQIKDFDLYEEKAA